MQVKIQKIIGNRGFIILSNTFLAKGETIHIVAGGKTTLCNLYAPTHRGDSHRIVFVPIFDSGNATCEDCIKEKQTKKANNIK